MNLYYKIKTFFSKENRANWCLFIFFVAALIAKCVLFYWLYRDTFVARERECSFYLAIIAISVAIASLIFLFKRKYWTIYLLVLLDVWMMANLWYYRTYNMLLDAYAVTMISNLNDGYWDSIIVLFRWKDMILVGCTLLFCGVFFCLNNRKTSPLYTPLLLTIALGMHVGATHLINAKNIQWPRPTINCFSYTKNSLLSTIKYEGRYSIIHSAILNINHLVQMCFDTRETIEFTSLEKQQIASLCQPYKPISPDGRVLLVLVESLETWALNPEVMPHTYKFMTEHPVLYVPKIQRQVAGGLSSDAQLIANTGLLPTQHGTVSHLYADNIFPSIAELYDTLTVSIASTNIDDCWHQWAINKAYHFDVAWSKNLRDSVLFKHVVRAVDKGFLYTQAFTFSTHTPFRWGAQRSSLHLPTELPETLSNYMKAFHYADAGYSVLFSALEKDSLLRNTTIIITGDHTILSNDERSQYNEAFREQNRPYDVIEDNYVPLIIYSPKIKENIRIDEVCYQMDIYPTILHLIGCEDYFWKGFGVNLLDSTARHNRPITEEEAYQLSDKLIRADYFRSIVDSLNITIKDREPIFEP